MTWRTVIINEHSKLSYQNNHLIYKSNDVKEKIHLSEIHTLLLETTDIVITTALIFKLVENNVKVIFCDDKRSPIAEMIPYYGSHDSSKKIGTQINWDTNIKKVVWTEVIRQKIENQMLHLGKAGYAEEMGKLQGYLEELELFDITNREGHAAKVYFNALFGKGFSREQDNDVNAFLDYGYSLILSAFNREIAKNGQLTQLGLKHVNQFNPYNLSSDLMEPFRILVDEKVAELKGCKFSENKYKLFELFNETYLYNHSNMYLVNIIEHFVKKTLQVLDTGEFNLMMEFRISEL